MSELQVIHREPEIVISDLKTLPPSNTASARSHQIIFSSPIEIENGQIHFKLTEMIEEKYYPFQYKKKTIYCARQKEIL